MPNVSFLRNNFASGEITPKLYGRTDLPAYLTGCKELTNFLITKTGALRRRPGTQYLGAAMTSTTASRLVHWPLTTGDYLILEIKPKTGGASSECRAWVGSTKALLGESDDTPWAEAHIAGVRFAAYKGELWAVHPSYAPRRFTYNAGGGAGAKVVIDSPTFTGTQFHTSGNYPATVAFYAGRLWFGSTTNNPRGIWGSKTFDPSTLASRFTDFTTGTTAADAIFIIETAMSARALYWLEPLLVLVGGGDRGIWQQSGTAIPQAFDMTPASSVAAANVPPAALGSVLLYAGADGKSLMGAAYAENAGGFQVVELSMTGKHLLTGGIKEIVAIQVPEPMAWIVGSDGSLSSFHFDPSAGVQGFASHEISGATVMSAAVGRGSVNDELWLCVKRGSAYSIEWIDLSEYENAADQHYVDSGVLKAGPATTFTGMTWLNGVTVDCLGDGAVMPQKIVSAGAVTYDASITAARIGVPMTSSVKPTMPDITTNGTGQGKKRRVEKITLRLYKSYGGKVGRDTATLETLPDTTPGVSVYGAAPVLFTGDKTKSFPGIVDDDQDILVVQDQPLPFNLLAIIPRVAVGEA